MKRAVRVFSNFRRKVIWKSFRRFSFGRLCPSQVSVVDAKPSQENVDFDEGLHTRPMLMRLFQEIVACPCRPSYSFLDHFSLALLLSQTRKAKLWFTESDMREIQHEYQPDRSTECLDLIRFKHHAIQIKQNEQKKYGPFFGVDLFPLFGLSGDCCHFNADGPFSFSVLVLVLMIRMCDMCVCLRMRWPNDRFHQIHSISWLTPVQITFEVGISPTTCTAPRSQISRQDVLIEFKT